MVLLVVGDDGEGIGFEVVENVMNVFCLLLFLLWDVVVGLSVAVNDIEVSLLLVFLSVSVSVSMLVLLVFLIVEEVFVEVRLLLLVFLLLLSVLLVRLNGGLDVKVVEVF